MEQVLTPVLFRYWKTKALIRLCGYTFVVCMQQTQVFVSSPILQRAKVFRRKSASKCWLREFIITSLIVLKRQLTIQTWNCEYLVGNLLQVLRLEFVYMCFVVTCWERADLLALICGVYCEFVTFPLVSWVRWSTWLYRFLIFAPLLTLES